MQSDCPLSANRGHHHLTSPCSEGRKSAIFMTVLEKQASFSHSGPTMATIANAELHLPCLSPHRDELRLILETALDAVVVMESNGVVADWNSHAVSIFGWSRGEAVGRTMADLIIPVRYREAHRIGIRRYLETGQGEVLGRHIELSGLKKNGEEFPIELSISPISRWQEHSLHRFLARPHRAQCAACGTV